MNDARKILANSVLRSLNEASVLMGEQGTWAAVALVYATDNGAEAAVLTQSDVVPIGALESMANDYAPLDDNKVVRILLERLTRATLKAFINSGGPVERGS